MFKSTTSGAGKGDSTVLKYSCTVPWIQKDTGVPKVGPMSLCYGTVADLYNEHQLTWVATLAFLTAKTLSIPNYRA